jgi:Spy/CpxP family protein refolding chaperone
MKRIISMATAAGLLAGALLLPMTLRADEKPAAGAEKGGKAGKDGFAEHMREKFGISEDQEAKLKTARRTKRDASEAAITDLKASARKLQDQLEDKAAEKDLTATLDKISASHKALRAAEDAFEASLSSILTPTQRAKMAVAMAAHMGAMHGAHGRPGMHGGAWKKGEDDKGGEKGEERHPDHDDDD